MAGVTRCAAPARPSFHYCSHAPSMHMAPHMRARMADLRRRRLEAQDVHQVALQEELAVAKEYLALEKVSFGPRLTVAGEIDPGTQEPLVPPFLLPPLVENAIRHGIVK